MPDTTPADGDGRRTTWPTAAPLQQAADLRRAAGDPLLADWLDATANALAWLAPYRDNEPGYGMWEAALAVARQILGTTTEAKRNEIRQSYSDLAAQAREDRDHEGAADVELKLRNREEQWQREDAAAVEPAAARPAPADRAATRDRIRQAICEASGFTWLPEELMEPDEYGEHADAVLAVLDAPVDRAAILRVVDRLAAHARGFQDVLDESDRGPWGKTIGADIAELRRLAGAAAAGVQQTITSDPLADCATEYRVPVPENGGTELRLRRGHAPYTSGWSVAVPGYGGGMALTELGWSDSIGALSADRLFCWPDAATAVDAARRALPAAPAAPEEPTR